MKDNKALKHLSLSTTAASILEYVSESTSIEKLTFDSKCLMTLFHFTLAPSLTYFSCASKNDVQVLSLVKTVSEIFLYPVPLLVSC